MLGVSVNHFAISCWRAGASGFVDFPIFVERARAFVETGELYVDPERPEAYAPAAAVYKFPPLYAVLLVPLVRDGVDRGLLARHWALQIVLYLAAAVTAAAALGPLRDPRYAFGAAVLALNFEPFFETLWRLQLETPLLLLIVLAIVLAQRRHDLAAGAAIGIAASLKVYPAFLLAWFALRGRWRSLAAAAGAAVAALGLGLAVIGPDECRRYFTEILPALLAEPPILNSENLAPARYLLELGASPEWARGLARLLALTLVAVSVLLALRAERGAGKGARRSGVELTLFVALMLLAMPNAWVNYQLLLLPGMFVLLAAGLRDPQARLTAWGALGLAFALSLFYQPCAPVEFGWPCTNTPYMLGLLQLPRDLHDGGVALRGLATLLVWAALARETARRHSKAALKLGDASARESA